EPSAVQSLALGDAVSGRDVLAVAPTGSGKTLVFAIAVAHQLTGSPSVPGRPRAVIVAPTRELAAQSTEILADVGAAAGLRVASFVGGQPLSRDRRTLVAPVDVVVGTPGRLVELLRTGILSAQDARVLVLDEADQLVGPSFAEQTGVLLDRCPDAVLLSATAAADDAVEDDLRARRPAVRIHRVATPSGPAPADAAGASGAPRRLVVVGATVPDDYAVTLAARCRRALFFVPRRDAVEPLRASIAATGVTAAGVTGSASPTRRSSAFAQLASGAVRVLVSTDLAGRGLDLDAVGHVVHVGPPHSVSDLVHRSGRTGRGDAAAGVVVAIVRPSRSPRSVPRHEPPECPWTGSIPAPPVPRALPGRSSAPRSPCAAGGATRRPRHAPAAPAPPGPTAPSGSGGRERGGRPARTDRGAGARLDDVGAGAHR